MESLPVELLEEIFNDLDLADLKALRQVSTSLARVIIPKVFPKHPYEIWTERTSIKRQVLHTFTEGCDCN